MRKGVVFDLDGVITDTAHYHFIAWRDMAAKIGIHIDEKFNETLKGIDRMGSLNRILAHGHKQISQEEKERLADEKNEEYKRLISHMTEKDLLPGAYDCLKTLDDMGIKLSLASASKNAPQILKSLKIEHFFQAIVDPSSVKHGKPDPEIYTKGAHVLGLTPEQCIGVEDAVAGVEAVKAAGMYCVGIGEKSVLTEADLVIPDLRSFPLGERFEEIP